ncbi:unnamed protein product [Amoebophrya sp. A120]|nr:unnamed protein product [Amoebophrya sp. A120]|eukprot:GSA120T00013571001.1
MKKVIMTKRGDGNDFWRDRRRRSFWWTLSRLLKTRMETQVTSL